MAVEVLDFLKNYYFIILYAMALILALVKYELYFDSKLKYLPIIIGYTLITEILGSLIAQNEGFQIVYLDNYSTYNSLILNVFEIIFFLYFCYVFWNVIQKTRFRKIIKYGMIIYLTISLINPFFQNPILLPQIYALSTGSIVLIIAIILYLYEIRSVANRTPKKNNLLFWISLGLLIFHIFYPIIMALGLYSYNLYSKLYGRQIHHILIASMYLCFILGFVFMRRVRHK